MSKITNELSREIYELATLPNRKMSNVEIGKKFGISERVVRFHVKKWESKVHEIAKNDQKINKAVTSNTLDVIAESLMQISVIKRSIQDARDRGVSPDKLSGLFNNWIRALELSSELLGNLNRAPQFNQLNIQGERRQLDIKAEVRKYITALDLLPQDDIIAIEAGQK
jgi:hypothetical protein